jgi:protein phosphatase
MREDYPLTAPAARDYLGPVRLAAIGITDVGRRRGHNEDAFLVMPEAGLFAVADGLGGHASGEVASRMAVEELARAWETADPGHDPASVAHQEARLREAIAAANRAIHDRSRASATPAGMGTTLVAGCFVEGGPLLVAHVGDSRAYLFRQGALRRLTEDHSLLQDFIRQSNPTPAEIEAYPHKNVIVRALGMRDEVVVDVSSLDVEEGDLLLLCCDGLFGMIPDERMEAILRAEGSEILRADQALVDAANDAGGADNVTSVLVQVVER